MRIISFLCLFLVSCTLLPSDLVPVSEPLLLSATYYVTPMENKLFLLFNQDMSKTVPAGAAGFQVWSTTPKVELFSVSSVEWEANNRYLLTLQRPLTNVTSANIGYDGENIFSVDGKQLQSFGPLAITFK